MDGLGAQVASRGKEEHGKSIDELLKHVQINAKDREAWMKLAVAYRETGDHSHQVWAWSRAVQHRSANRHCRKWGHLLRFTDSPDHACCLYCGESFTLER